MKIQQLTFTRFIAAIGIVIFHYGMEGNIFGNQNLRFIFENANLGVSYFFVLSGFVMIVSYAKKAGNLSKKQYYRNRLARIYPSYLIALLMTLVFLINRQNILIDTTLNALVIQSWIPEKALTVNSYGWSISVEFLFYLLFPFILKAIHNKKNIRCFTYATLLLWLTTQLCFNYVYYSDPNSILYKYFAYHPLLHLNEFLIGNLGGLIYLKYLSNIKRNYSILILLIIVLILVIIRFNKIINLHNGFLAPIFLIFILLISTSTDKFTAIMKNKSFLFLGNISFAIYIFQKPIWYIFSDYRMNKYLGLDKIGDFDVSFTIRLLILIIWSSIFYWLIEDPLRIKLRSNPHNIAYNKSS